MRSRWMRVKSPSYVTGIQDYSLRQVLVSQDYVIWEELSHESYIKD